MSAVELFGFAAVVAMVVFYACEERAPACVLGFAIACAAASLYAVLIGSWPFALAEGVWALVAGRRWLHARRRAAGHINAG